jgi:hypothetical protein
MAARPNRGGLTVSNRGISRLLDVGWWRAFYDWLGTAQSANLALWVSSVGTAGALLLGFTILVNDRRRDASRQADRIVGWWGSRIVDGQIVWLLRLSNTSDQPITAASVWFVSRDRRSYYCAKWSVSEQFEAGASESRDFEWKVMLSFPGDELVRAFSFVDAYGRHWGRDLDSGQLMTRREIERVILRGIARRPIEMDTLWAPTIGR